MIKLMPKLVAGCGGQCVMAWFFYRSQVVSHMSWADSEWVVFGLPLATGFAFYTWIMIHSAFPQMSVVKRAVVILVISAAVAVISSILGSIIGFNLYGT